MPRVRVFDISISAYVGSFTGKMVLTPVQIRAILELERMVNSAGGEYPALIMSVFECDDDEAEAWCEEHKE